MQNIDKIEELDLGSRLYGMAYGYDAYYLSSKISEYKQIIHIALDDIHMMALKEQIKFFNEDIEIICFPAWDCLPYDRVSPNSDILGERVDALIKMSSKSDKPRVILTTVNAVIQKIPAREEFQNSSLSFKIGSNIDLDNLYLYLANNGYSRVDTVQEAGEFAVRGGLIDIFPSGTESPIRVDLFGDEIEQIRIFDIYSQVSSEKLTNITLRPTSEIFLEDKYIKTFRSKYRELFGSIKDDDLLYQSISDKRQYAGMEHWLPLFYDKMETIFDYIGKEDCLITFANDVDIARIERIEQIEDFYQSRIEMQEVEERANTNKYNPIPSTLLYLDDAEWLAQTQGLDKLSFFNFSAPLENANDCQVIKAQDFGNIRATKNEDLFHEIKKYIIEMANLGKRIVFVSYSHGARERINKLLNEHGITNANSVNSWVDVVALPKNKTASIVMGLEHGFVAEEFVFITEQDIFGDRLARPKGRKRKSENFIADMSTLNIGDYVVHEEHGIGQFQGLENLAIDGIAHDFIKLTYFGDDKLFVPVENLEILSRYGSEDAGAVLDKLGGAGWQSRKARIKKDLMAMADELLKIAAARVLRKTEPINISESDYQEFCARFPYNETEDQLNSIESVINDMKLPQAMDRLVCGDVGFGKTEVALRAAFVAAMAGYQVAIVTPTTLLCRQHYQGFIERFKGFPLRIAQLSRLETAKNQKLTKQELEDGNVNIVIGTHALLSENIKFNNLGLLIVDEEQRFGVKQKERLKNLRENVHILTLTATPIPRTLQLALAGVRELSLIATPPVDRLAVRTFVLPFDKMIIREALMREYHRGGQSFYVCPRIADLAEMETILKEMVPELKIVIAHGQMLPKDLEDRIDAFYDGKYDILLSTNIVESGLDITNANTMVIHRAELFGLAQLYQLRGRIGRSKIRAYAYMSYKPAKKLTKTASMRLKAIEQLNTLGAGFQLASHDMDIRGSGNLLGEEQSGHIKEIGVELYQQMLEEAVAAAKEGNIDIIDKWTPNINLGISVMIPESYIKDLNVRLGIYRRIAELENKEDINNFIIELIDRFGEVPDDVDNLLEIVEIKQLAKKAGVSQVDAGPKGAVITFRNNKFDNVEKLFAYIGLQNGTVKIRKDEKLTFIRMWAEDRHKVKGVKVILSEIINL